MMFLMRCAFCLSIVYAMILSSHGAFTLQGDHAQAAKLVSTEAKALVETAAAQATAFCARHAEQCLADATRLTSLFHAAEPESAAVELAAVGERKDVPLPVPDPRRRHRDAMLTQTP